jgi:hypothetical protein
MGKKLIIKGADFSLNGILTTEYIADTIPKESLSWHSAISNFPNSIWTNFTINGESCYHSIIYGAVVKCNPNSYIKLYATKEDGSFRLLQTFNIPNSVNSGEWVQLLLTSPETMGNDEYLGIGSNSIYYIEDKKSTGTHIKSGGNNNGNVSPISIDNTFPYHRIYAIK